MEKPLISAVHGLMVSKGKTIGKSSSNGLFQVSEMLDSRRIYSAQGRVSKLGHVHGYWWHLDLDAHFNSSGVYHPYITI